MYLLFLYPKLDKPILLYKHRYFSIRNLTSSIQNHTQIPYTHISIQIFIVPYLCSSFLLSFFLFSSSSSSSLSSFLKDQKGDIYFVLLFILSYPLFISLSKEETSSIFPSSHMSLPQIFLPYFILISFFYYPFVLTFIFLFSIQFIKILLCHINLLNYDPWVMNW